MTRSSARFLAYDLRPAKQAERLMLVEYLRCAAECGLKLGDYRYVGMGGNRFYDFLLLHRFAGVRSMISLEHDDEMFLRARFNKPFEFIEVKQETVADFLASDNYEEPSIVWLDYDGGLSRDMLTDVETLGVVAQPGSFFFVTALAEYPRFLQKINDEQRLNWFREELGDVAQGLAQDDMQISRSALAIQKCIRTALESAFAFRGDGKLSLHFAVEYSDSTRMVTIGGFFGSEEMGDEVSRRVRTNIPALADLGDVCFRLKSLNITDRERQLFDIAVTANDKRKREYRKLIELGFTERDLQNYASIFRFTPRYVEAII